MQLFLLQVEYHLMSKTVRLDRYTKNVAWELISSTISERNNSILPLRKTSLCCESRWMCAGNSNSTGCIFSFHAYCSTSSESEYFYFLLEHQRKWLWLGNTTDSVCLLNSCSWEHSKNIRLNTNIKWVDKCVPIETLSYIIYLFLNFGSLAVFWPLSICFAQLPTLNFVGNPRFCTYLIVANDIKHTFHFRYIFGFHYGNNSTLLGVRHNQLD